MPQPSAEVFAIACAALGLVALVIALRRLLHARFFAATRSALLGLLLVAGAGFLFAFSMTLHTYARLTYEQPVAQLAFVALGPQLYSATLVRVPSGDVETYALNGDEWQLDARVLKWRGVANLLGLDARYRLERLGGRYVEIEQERAGPRSVYALGAAPTLDLWLLARAYPRWLPFVDAVYGSATYLPMADGARFQVTISQSGLVARPTNAAAEAAVGAWH
jgi:hypothetical protein